MIKKSFILHKIFFAAMSFFVNVFHSELLLYNKQFRSKFINLYVSLQIYNVGDQTYYPLLYNEKANRKIVKQINWVNFGWNLAKKYILIYQKFVEFPKYSC